MILADQPRRVVAPAIDRRDRAAELGLREQVTPGVDRQRVDDLDRLAAFLIETSPALATETAPLIIGALRSLRDHPLIGRPVEEGLRELLISRGRTGYVALYRYNPVADRVLVLRVRHQRELGTD